MRSTAIEPGTFLRAVRGVSAPVYATHELKHAPVAEVEDNDLALVIAAVLLHTYGDGEEVHTMLVLTSRGTLGWISGGNTVIIGSDDAGAGQNHGT